MPSFDVVSKTDLAEVENAINTLKREISTRYDFKGTTAEVELKDNKIELLAADDYKLKAMREMFAVALTKRKLDPRILDYGKEEKASGGTMRIFADIKQGIDQETAKKITKHIKATKMKVQASIQGDEVRITGKKRDDLQQAINEIKEMGLELPLQYVNFRD